MTRSGESNRKTQDDIPIALRSGARRKQNFRNLIYLIILTIVFGIVAALIIPNFTSDFTQVNPADGIPKKSYLESRLLGHFPYPQASKKDLVSLYPGLEIHRDTYKALKAMRTAAAQDGVDLVLLSGYRSIDLQRRIFYGRKSFRNQIAIERAKVSAPPGYSEHSTGYAIDLGDALRRDTDLEVDFEETRAFKWLQLNAAKYHFVLSFPRNNFQKVSYEPWHWRYEGTVEALRRFEPANEFRRANALAN